MTVAVGGNVGVEAHHVLAVHIGSLEACTACLHGREGLAHSLQAFALIVGLDDHLQ